jgi:hypothetical protein
MSLAEKIVDCPRGRAVCAALIEAGNDEVRRAVLDTWFVRPGSPSDPEAAQARLVGVLEAISPAQVVLEVSENVVLQAVQAAVHGAHYWQPPDDDDLVYARPDVRPALLSIAVALTESLHTRSWGDPADLQEQFAVRYQLDDDRYSNRRPSSEAIDLHAWRTKVVEEEVNAQRYRPSDPAAHYSGSWWSSPVFTGALQTTKAIAGSKNLRLGLVEDWMNCDRLLIWPVSVDSGPRVFEITGPDRWALLVSTYPLEVTASRRHEWYQATGEALDWLIPDWSAVAADYDGVHLTMWGYLTTPGMAIPTTGGATMLAGWNPDTTYWLHPELVTYADEPAQWRLVDHQWQPQ